METMNTTANNQKMICNLEKKAERLSDQITFGLVPYRRSKQQKAVWLYAQELLDRMRGTCQNNPKDLFGLFTSDGVMKPAELNKYLLNGACDWKEYSKDGYSLRHCDDIRDRIFTNDEKKKLAKQNVDYLEWQARGLSKAAEVLEQILCRNTKTFLF